MNTHDHDHNTHNEGQKSVCACQEIPMNNSNEGRRVGHVCPCCGEGKLALREHGNRTGAFFLGCNAFPTCRWACDPSPIDVRNKRSRRRAWARIQARKLEERWEQEEELARHYWDHDPEEDPDHDPDAELSSDLYLWLG